MVRWRTSAGGQAREMKTPRLSMVLGSGPQTADIRSGKIAIDGVTPEFVQVKPLIGAYRRMVRDLEFDVCEVAPTTYVIARSLGAPIIALPVILGRRFHHHGLVCRPGSGIRSPRDLEGKSVGVRAYSVTTGVWARGILENEFGVNSAKIDWVVDDEEAVSGLRLPPNVRMAPDGRSLRQLMESGELHAAFTGPAGIGREGAPQAGWEASPHSEAATEYYDLFEDSRTLEAEFFARTGIYPMHNLLVVREDRIASQPGLAEALFSAFVEAKASFLGGLASGATGPEFDRYRDLASIVGDDPLPYGFDQNRESIAALILYSRQQGLLSGDAAYDDFFVSIQQ